MKDKTQKFRKATRMILALQIRWLIRLLSFKTTMICSANFNLSLLILIHRPTLIKTLALSDLTCFTNKRKIHHTGEGDNSLQNQKQGLTDFWFYSFDKFLQSSS